MARRESANKNHPKYTEYTEKFRNVWEEYNEPLKIANAENNNAEHDRLSREQNRRLNEIKQEYSFLWDE